MMARVLLGFCALGVVDGLSLRSQHVMASNRTARGHHSSLPSMAFAESQVLAALDSGAKAPFADLLNLLTAMKRRYICEDANAGEKAEDSAKQCDASQKSLSDISDAEGRKLTTKTNECDAANSAVDAKKKQIEDSTAERKTANDKIPGYQKRIVDGTNTDATAASTFGKERDDTNGAIQLVKAMAEKSTTLTLLQIATKVKSLPEGTAKDMGSLALLQMKMQKKKGDNLDTNAYKALLGELATELAKYLKLLTDTEGTRAAAWVTAKKGFLKDLKEAKDSVALQDSNLIQFGKQLVTAKSAQSQCAKELLIQKETTSQTALDAKNKAEECVTMKKRAKEAAEQRKTQLSTVNDLLNMLVKSGIADHVKEAVKSLKAKDVKDFQCSSDWVRYDAPLNTPNPLTKCGAANSPGIAIANAEDCKTAWEAQGVSVTEVEPGSWSGRGPTNGYKNWWVPTGCSMQKSGGKPNGRLHFNTAPAGKGGIGYDLLCIKETKA